MNAIRRMTQMLLAVSGILLLAACASDGTQPDSRSMQNAQQDIQDMHSQFLKAFNAKDPSALAATFTDDGMLMPPNAPEVKTQLAVQEFARQFFGSSKVSGMLLNVSETTITGDYAFCTGYYTMLAADGTSLDHGKFLEVVKQQGRDWKIYRDIYNSDLPVPAAAPAPASAAPTAAPAAATH
ncbi:MAG: YybH family protein [Bacillota bacterium]